MWFCNFFRAVAGKHTVFQNNSQSTQGLFYLFRKLPQVVPWALTAQRKPGGSCCRSPLEERASCSVATSWLSFDGEINSFHNHIILVALCPEFTQTWKKWKLIEKEKKKILPLLPPLQTSHLEKWWEKDSRVCSQWELRYLFSFAILGIKDQKKAIGQWGGGRYGKRV